MGYLNGMILKEPDQKQEFIKGEIYYIENNKNRTEGSEQANDRPAIIVSNDLNNKYSDVLEMVYLTTQPKTDLPTHVTIRSIGRRSTALCEQPTPVAKSRIKRFMGQCTEAEMQRIDAALLIGFGITHDKKMQQTMEELLKEKIASGGDMAQDKKEDEKMENERLEQELKAAREEAMQQRMEAVSAKAERDVYKGLYDSLLMGVIGRKEEKACTGQ